MTTFRLAGFIAPMLLIPAMCASAAPGQTWNLPPLRAVDPSHVRISSDASTPGPASVVYSNLLAPLYQPSVPGVIPNTVGDEINVVGDCGDATYLDDVRFGMFTGLTCETDTCDLYFLVFDNAAGPFGSFIGGFYLADVPTGCGDGGGPVAYEVFDLSDAGITIPILGPTQDIVVSVSPPGSNGAAFQSQVPGIAPLAAGSPPTVGTSTNVLWCDVDFDGDLTSGEQFFFNTPFRGNLYLELKTHRPCPSCDKPLQQYMFYVNGTGNNTQWSWSITSDDVEFDPIENLYAGPAPMGATALTVAQAFAQSINDTAALYGCSANAVFADTTDLSNSSKAVLNIYVRLDGVMRLLVENAAGIEPTCLVPQKPLNACAFNPTILEVKPSGHDCNANGIDDEMDIEAGLSLDTNANGIPDECEHGIHKLGTGSSNGTATARPR